MAAITENTTDRGAAIRFLESVTITNQTAASTTVRKFIRIPGWARSLDLLLYVDSMGGTGESLDFDCGIPDIGTEAKLIAPDDGTLHSFFDQVGDFIVVTAATAPSLIRVTISPDVDLDANGVPDGDCYYHIKAELPPVLYYQYTTTDGGDDADYAFRVAAAFRRDRR